MNAPLVRGSLRTGWRPTGSAASRRGMMRVLRNEQLVEAFLADTAGAPIALRATLEVDDSTNLRTPFARHHSSRFTVPVTFVST